MSVKVIDNDAPTLETVNQNLLKKLNEVILDVEDATSLLSLTEAVAKLNSSSKNNDMLGQPKSEKDKTQEEVDGMFGVLGEGEVINA